MVLSKPYLHIIEFHNLLPWWHSNLNYISWSSTICIHGGIQTLPTYSELHSLLPFKPHLDIQEFHNLLPWCYPSLTYISWSFTGSCHGATQALPTYPGVPQSVAMVLSKPYLHILGFHRLLPWCNPSLTYISWSSTVCCHGAIQALPTYPGVSQALARVLSKPYLHILEFHGPLPWCYPSLTYISWSFTGSCHGAIQALPTYPGVPRAVAMVLSKPYLHILEFHGLLPWSYPSLTYISWSSTGCCHGAIQALLTYPGLSKAVAMMLSKPYLHILEFHRLLPWCYPSLTYISWSSTGCCHGAI